MKKYLVTETRVYSVVIEADNDYETEQKFNSDEFPFGNIQNDYIQVEAKLIKNGK